MPDRVKPHIRSARRDEARLIRRLVWRARLDPTGLNWRHFVAAEDQAGQVVGIGQVRKLPGCRELGSLVVDRAHRGRGVGSAIVRYLLAAQPGEIYLNCPLGRTSFYRQFGFRAIRWREAPLALKLKMLLPRLLRWPVVTMRLLAEE